MEQITPYGYVYLTTNLVNQKMYVGLHSGKFNPRYFGSGNLIRRALLKYGRRSFSVIPLAYANTVAELNDLERKVIKEYREKYGIENLYNLDPGGYQDGFAGMKRSPETCKKIGDLHRGKKHSEETKRKLSLQNMGNVGWWNKGRHHTEETKKKISLCKIGKPSWNKGISPSEETLKRMSAASKGRPAWNAGTNLSGMKGKKHSAETIEKMSLTRLKNPSPGMTGKKQSAETVEAKRLTRQENSIRKLWAECILNG